MYLGPSLEMMTCILGPVDLQGEVQSLTLQAMSSKNNVTVSPSGNQVTYVVDTLEPNTDYTVTLTVTIFGGAYLTSQPVLVKTKDGGRFLLIVFVCINPYILLFQSAHLNAYIVNETTDLCM